MWSKGVMIFMTLVGSMMSLGVENPCGGGWKLGISMLEENLEATVLVFCSVIFWISNLVALSL